MNKLGRCLLFGLAALICLSVQPSAYGAKTAIAGPVTSHRLHLSLSPTCFVRGAPSQIRITLRRARPRAQYSFSWLFVRHGRVIQNTWMGQYGAGTRGVVFFKFPAPTDWPLTKGHW